MDKDRFRRIRDLSDALDHGASENRVIVTYKDRIDEAGLDAIRNRRGNRIHKRLDGIRGFAGTLGRRDIEDLAADPRVFSISPDRRVAGMMDMAVPTVGSDRVAENLGLTGANVTIALIDSGLAPGSAITGRRILASIDFTDEDIQNADPFGHGSHIAGIIGGSGRGNAAHGIAPGTKFVSLKVLDEEGAGYVSDVIEALQWTIENKNEHGIRIVNLSLGHPVMESYRTDPLTRAVERAWKAGLTVVVSAGNRGRDGYMTVNSPGNDPHVLTVGAMNDLNTASRNDDIITTYSGRGPSYGDHVLKPDLVAPGNRIISTPAPDARLAEILPENVIGDKIELSGSSMATGVVSGAAAILLERNSFLTNDQIKAILMYSAEKLDGEEIFAVGAGHLHLVHALANTGPFPPIRFDSSSPIVLRNQDGGYDLVLGGALTGPSGVTGDVALWGDTALWADTALWSDVALWGDTALWSDTILASGD